MNEQDDAGLQRYLQPSANLTEALQRNITKVTEPGLKQMLQKLAKLKAEADA
jgi:hypothetical protein